MKLSTVGEGVITGSDFLQDAATIIMIMITKKEFIFFMFKKLKTVKDIFFIAIL